MSQLPLVVTDVAEALRTNFGHAEFRPGQRRAVEAAVDGEDVLLVMPTGAGKSICYQLPALLDDRLTVVVSPLVSLMQDQVGALGGSAALINAQQDADANRAAFYGALRGDFKMLYVAPERFANEAFTDRLAEAEIGLFVVDEAHCVSQWGHDFRPDYMRLGEVARRLGAGSIFAATATATPRVAGDILTQLQLKKPVKITTGFDRPNLSYDVIPSGSDEFKLGQAVAALRQPDALPAIVYAGTRKLSNQVASGLSRELGFEVPTYHAGMEREARSESQRAFMSGEVPVVVATNAFGMGVDKADVRTVIHITVPSSLEAYYQEAGRAGRDGKPSRCLLLASGRDKGLHVFFIERTESPEAVRHQWRQYHEVWGFVEGERCRRAAILRHFGDHTVAYADARCCDVCDEPIELRVEELSASAASAVGARNRARSAPAKTKKAPAMVNIKVSADEIESLRSAIMTLVADASPAVGRTRAVEILRGGRSKITLANGYDQLPVYGQFSEWHKDRVLEEVDALIESGRLGSTGGRFPKLAIG